jgi:hypothetical protein
MLSLSWTAQHARTAGLGTLAGHDGFQRCGILSFLAASGQGRELRSCVGRRTRVVRGPGGTESQRSVVTLRPGCELLYSTPYTYPYGVLRSLYKYSVLCTHGGRDAAIREDDWLKLDFAEAWLRLVASTYGAIIDGT